MLLRVISFAFKFPLGVRNKDPPLALLVSNSLTLNTSHMTPRSLHLAAHFTAAFSNVLIPAVEVVVLLLLSSIVLTELKSSTCTSSKSLGQWTKHNESMDSVT